MSEHIRGSYDDALHKSTYTLLYSVATDDADDNVDDIRW